MKNTLTIRGLGRTIRGVPSPDRPTGLFLKKDGMQGWEGLPAGRREALARALTHGEHDVPVRLPARVITYDGWAIATSLESLRHESQSVTGWGATGDRFSLEVTHQQQKLNAIVRRILGEAEDTGRRRGRWLIASWQLQFLAADPRKYGTTTLFPEAGLAQAVLVHHRGNFPAYPIVETPSAPSNYTIQTPAGIFSVAGAAAGGTHRVDLRTGRVTRNDVWLPDVGHGPLWACPDNDDGLILLSVPGRVVMVDTYV